jgi:Flp pilus assembly protein TadG
MPDYFQAADEGQAVIEVAITLLAFLILTGGLLDLGRGFYQYNAVAAAARYGARWGSVEGGTCTALNQASTSDWCNQLGGTSQSFWAQSGSAPLQSAGTSCPSTYQAGSSSYYTVSDFKTSSSTTIVGAIAQHFDTNSSSTSAILGLLTPGFDLTKLKVCIELPVNPSTGTWSHTHGDNVKVYVYYPFNPATSLVTTTQLNLVASSTYTIE